MNELEYTLSLSEIPSMIKDISPFAPSVILLQGDLASGKTTLVQQWAYILGIEERVTSPTFNFCQIYEKKCKKIDENIDKTIIFHYDLYLKSFFEYLELGLLEELEKKALHFIEWGEQDLSSMLCNIGIPHWIIKITPRMDNKRHYCVTQAFSAEHFKNY